MMTKNKSIQGFTLPELLISISIIGVLMVGISSLYLAQNRLTNNEYKAAQARMDITAGANSIMPVLFSVREIKSGAVINEVAYTTSDNTLVVSVPSVNSANHPLAVGEDIVVYTWQEGSLSEVVSAGADSVRKSGTRSVIQDLSSLQFQYENTEQPIQSRYVDIRFAKTFKASHGYRESFATHRAMFKNKN